MSDKILYLLDGQALIYRAHFAFINRPLVNSKGLNTSAISGFVRTLWDLMKNQSPSHIAVSFDVSGKTFRNDIFPEYKANREAQPEDISAAIPIIKDILNAFHIPIIELQNYEADDVIGTIAKKAEKEGFTVYMVTPDKDFGQLVTDNIFIYKPSRQGNGVEIQGPAEIQEKWDVERCDQVIDMLGLAGDSVDNIPGVPGVGPKTGAKLLKEFDTIEGIIENIDKVKGKLQDKIRDNIEQARLSRVLATIDTDAPIDFNDKRFTIDPPDKEKLAEIFKDLEFRSLAVSIIESDKPKEKMAQPTLFSVSEENEGGHDVQIKSHSVAEVTINDGTHNYQLVNTDKEITSLVKKLESSDAFCFDTETTGLDAMEAELVGIAFAINEGEAWYVPIPEDQSAAQERITHFANSLENPKIKKIGQNLKYDILILKHYGIDVSGVLADTMIMHYLLEPELRHNMDYLAETYLKYKPIPITNLIGKKGKNQKSMRDIPPEEVLDYAAEDADITLRLYHVLNEEYTDPELVELYHNLEMPLIKVLADMEYAGINLDVPQLKAYSKELGKKIKKSEREIHELAGEIFNIKSPKQVGEVLFGKLEIPYKWRKTKTGQYSTSEEKLSELKGEHDIVQMILDYRGLTKLKSTYVDALPSLVNSKTGRIHTSYNQALASTGRLSSNNPNLQNIPIRSEDGRRVREAFVPASEDYVLYAADYSQIELRLIAAISGDEAMLEAFRNNQDIHRATAAKVYEVPYDEVTADQRRNAKTVNFSIIYGAGATNLSRQLDIPRKEAGQLIEQYFKQYSELKKYMDETVEYARTHGFVKTIVGRKRGLRDINSRNGMLRSTAERVAINTPIQGSAADMIKIAMIDIQNYLKSNNYKTKMLLQVHDELVFDMHKDELEELGPVIIRLMSEAIENLDVPILVEADSGNNWLEAH